MRIRGLTAVLGAMLAAGGVAAAAAPPAPVAPVTGTQTAAALPPATQARLSLAIRNQMTDNRLPGVVVGVWTPRGSYVRAFGFANRATGAAARVTDHVRIASITKTFTATAVLQLVDQGRLSLDDRLERYVPAIANGETITIRQLLNMTAGVYDYTSAPRLGTPFYDNPTRPLSTEQVLAIIRSHRPAFAPGTKAVYSDSNYYLLGMVVEKVTGRPLEDVVTDQIIRPLGLTHTSFPTVNALPRPFAHGYFGGVENNAPIVDRTLSSPSVGWAAGAMVSTLGDMRRWAVALADGTLLSPGLQAQRLQFERFPNPGGVPIGYGLGIFRIDDMIGHNGAIVGYSTAAFHVPAKNATIVVWTNNSSNFSTPATTISFDVAKILGLL